MTASQPRAQARGSSTRRLGARQRVLDAGDDGTTKSNQASPIQKVSTGRQRQDERESSRARSAAVASDAHCLGGVQAGSRPETSSGPGACGAAWR